MAIDSEYVKNRHTITNALRVIVVLMFLPLLPIAIALDLWGAAERMSMLPGIQKDGGLVSGLATLILIGAVLTILIGGVVIAFSLGTAGIPDGGGSSATSTPQQTTTLTPTRRSTPTPTQTATLTPQLSELERFREGYRSLLRRTMENDVRTGVPVLGMKYHVKEDGTTELWVVYNECNNYEYARDQRMNIGNIFANSVAAFDGNKPNILRVYGVVNLESHDDITTRIPTSSAIKSVNGSISPSKYTNDWINRTRTPTESEREIAFRMTVNESGQSKAEEVFNKERPINETDRGCPAGAEPAED